LFVSGDVFDLDVFRPWEFNVTFPIRSIIIPSITVGLPFRILKCISNVTSYLFNVCLLTPYMMLVIPRLAVTCLSLICDYCLWHMCCLYGQNCTARLTVFASSYIVLIHGTRTFSNTVEMILLAILLTLVVDTMKHTHEVSTSAHNHDSEIWNF
jgi:phosphatidylinositol glycan class Z